jgi:hypothetical protein
MIRTVKTILVTVLIGMPVAWAIQGHTPSEPVEQQQAVEMAVLKVHAEMAKAEKALDAEEFFACIPDFDKGLILQDGIMFQTRQEALDAVKTGFAGLARIERTYDRTYVTVISPEVALLTARGTSSATLADGRTLSNPFVVSSLFVLRDGQWKLLHGHYSLPNPR